MTTCNRMSCALRSIDYKEFAQEILSHWGSLDKPHGDGNTQTTILFDACRYCDLQAIRMLLDAGADPLAKCVVVTTHTKNTVTHEMVGSDACCDNLNTPITAAEYMRTIYDVDNHVIAQQCLALLSEPSANLSWTEFADEYKPGATYTTCGCILSEQEVNFTLEYMKKHGLEPNQCIMDAKGYAQEFREWLKKKVTQTT